MKFIKTLCFIGLTGTLIGHLSGEVDNRTILFCAAETGAIAVVEDLLNNKKALGLKEAHIKFAQELAKENGHQEVTKLFLVIKK